MTAMFAPVWIATAILLPPAILVLFGRAPWLGITAHTLKECATFPVTPAKRTYPTEPVHEPESTYQFFDGPEISCAASLTFVRSTGVGEGFLPRPRLQVVHGTVPQKCARKPLPGRAGILYRPALGELRGRPLPTSSTRAPEATPN